MTCCFAFQFLVSAILKYDDWQKTKYNAQDEERTVCVCLNPFDVIAVALARYLFIEALLILGDVPEARGDIVKLSGWATITEKL